MIKLDRVIFTKLGSVKRSSDGMPEKGVECNVCRVGKFFWGEEEETKERKKR